jgi:hypothetical protein
MRFQLRIPSLPCFGISGRYGTVHLSLPCPVLTKSRQTSNSSEHIFVIDARDLSINRIFVKWRGLLKPGTNLLASWSVVPVYVGQLTSNSAWLNCRLVPFHSFMRFPASSDIAHPA